MELCQKANDELAALVKRHPGRFEAFATLPWVNPTAAADELRRVVNEFGFKGVLISNRPKVGATFLDDAYYEPVWEALTDLDLPIYIHPGFPDECKLGGPTLLEPPTRARRTHHQGTLLPL